MGIWDFISSGTESVKRNSPDLATPVTKVCKSTYYYSAAAVRMIDNVVRVNGVQNLGQYIYMPDEEGRAKIVNFSTKFVKNASVYAVKEAANIFIPGGRAVSQIYSQTVREMQIESKKNQNTLCDKEMTGNSSKDTSSTSPLGLLDGAEMLENRELQLSSDNKVQVDSFAPETPEDVLRVFMMKEFSGSRYLDNLLVPDHRQQKKDSSGSKIVKERSKDKSPSRPRLDKQDFTVMREEMQAKMEKLQDDMNNMKQQNEVSAKCTNGLDSFEFSDEPIKSSTPTKSKPKKVLIRSRM
ncbi:uncharacterized protein LOC125868204 [Solanum stenotomum]|uniref:uncharacterized protein LOC125868204 n=1 Tax=Solanum stenotomum TaxID=172797 RepID=UPI0020D02EA1|nr:uncharacterized protein LOC125868204 [Solanum stenotomum]